MVWTSDLRNQCMQARYNAYLALVVTTVSGSGKSCYLCGMPNVKPSGRTEGHPSSTTAEQDRTPYTRFVTVVRSALLRQHRSCSYLPMIVAAATDSSVESTASSLLYTSGASLPVLPIPRVPAVDDDLM